MILLYIILTSLFEVTFSYGIYMTCILILLALLSSNIHKLSPVSVSWATSNCSYVFFHCISWCAITEYLIRPSSGILISISFASVFQPSILTSVHWLELFPLRNLFFILILQHFDRMLWNLLMNILSVSFLYPILWFILYLVLFCLLCFHLCILFYCFYFSKFVAVRYLRFLVSCFC